MPDDTETIRPHLGAELVAELDDAIREHVRIPPDRFSVGDRVGVLLEEYRAAGERVDELEEALASREHPRS